MGTFPLGDGRSMTLNAWMAHDDATGIVTGEQIYELRRGEGAPYERRILPVRFALMSRETFESDAHATGWNIERLFGDYRRTRFDERTSPFMIWRLSAAA